MHLISPLARAGFIILAASMEPSPAPAPTRICNSSINRIQSSCFFTSSKTFFNRSSNSPLYFVPATTEDIFKEMILQFFKISGTSLLIIRCAKPSAIAVFPTPGSPIRTGLFLFLRERIWITLLISVWRPTTGSIFPCFALSFKSTANSPKSPRFSFFSLPFSSDINCSKARFNLPPVTLNCSNMRIASPPPSWIMASNKCSVPT